MAGKHPENKQTVTCWVDKKFVNRIDKLSEKAGLTRSKLVENLLEVAVGEMELMRSLGILSTAIVFRDLKENIKKWSEKESKKLVKAQLV